MDLLRGAVALESAQFQSGEFAEDLIEEMKRLRNTGDFSQSAMKKCKVPAITRLYTDISLDFIVSDKIRDNAYFVIPTMDANHPFLKQMGIEGYSSSGISLQSIRESANKCKEAGVDLRTGRVRGYFKQVKVTIVLAHNLFTDKKYKTEHICGIFAHELGHAFTYFEYLGNIVRRSVLIDQASKTVINPNFNAETKTKLLKEVERQLGTEPLELEKSVNLPDRKAKLKVETALITDGLFNHTRTESSTPFYDARNIEQLADQFCVIHGMGRWQAEALSVIYDTYRDPSRVTTAEFLAMELLKTLLFLIVTLAFPLIVLLLFFSLTPSAQWYDGPKQRIEFLRRQLISHLKMVRDPMIKERIMSDIKALDDLLEKYSGRKTLFNLYLNHLSIVGRRMYKEENFRKQLEELINNDLYIKAEELEDLK